MKSCQLIKSKDKIKIVTAYNLDVGYYRLSTPIFILGLDVDANTIVKTVIESLNSSSDLSLCITYSTKVFLKLLKERSFSSMYKNTRSCFISLENDQLTITPFQKEFRGLNLDVDRCIVLHYSKITDEEMWYSILQVLS